MSVINPETIYVVGFKSYDECHKLIRKSFVYIDGPFMTKESAMQCAENECKKVADSYRSFCDCEMYINNDSVSLIRINNMTGEKYEVLSYSAIQLENKKGEGRGPTSKTASKKQKDKECVRLLSSVYPED